MPPTGEGDSSTNDKVQHLQYLVDHPQDDVHPPTLQIMQNIIDYHQRKKGDQAEPEPKANEQQDKRTDDTVQFKLFTWRQDFATHLQQFTQFYPDIFISYMELREWASQKWTEQEMDAVLSIYPWTRMWQAGHQVLEMIMSDMTPPDTAPEYLRYSVLCDPLPLHGTPQHVFLQRRGRFFNHLIDLSFVASTNWTASMSYQELMNWGRMKWEELELQHFDRHPKEIVELVDQQHTAS